MTDRMNRAVKINEAFANWWLDRVLPARGDAWSVPTDQEPARDYNRVYVEGLRDAVFPVVDAIVELLRKSGIVHRVTTWGNHLSLRIFLNGVWGELVICQSREDAMTFDSNVGIGMKCGDYKIESHTHLHDLRADVPRDFVFTVVQFFMEHIARAIPVSGATDEHRRMVTEVPA